MIELYDELVKQLKDDEQSPSISFGETLREWFYSNKGKEKFFPLMDNKKDL